MQSPKLRSTKDYSLFKLTNKNRPIDALHIKKLMPSMKLYGWLPSFPVTCRRAGDKFIIDDGQHRFAIAKELGLCVWFVDVGEVDIDIPLVNHGQTSWTHAQFVGSYAARGYSDYVELIEFKTQHGIPLLVSAAILAGTCSCGNIYPQIKNGTFKIKDRQYANKVAAVYAEVRKVNAVRAKEPMLQAVAAVARVASVNMDDLMRNLHRGPELLKEHSTRDGALEVLESIYNFGRRVKVPLKIAAENAMRARNAINKKK